MEWIWSMLVKALLVSPSRFRKRAAAWLADFVLKRYATIELSGKENLDRFKGTNVLFIANHLSNSDAIVLDHVLWSFNPVFLAGIKLTRESSSKLMLETFKIIPIDPAKADRQALVEAISAVKRGNSVLIFPEGTRSRTGSLIPGKKGVVLLAKMAGVPIVPIALEGTEKLLPINDEDMSREFFRHATVKVKIGKALQLPEQKPNETKHQWEVRGLDYLMSEVAALLSPAYRGVYGQKNNNEEGILNEGL
jgi:1-acyl-sn-glycerol-3-phosphate acyltransferase